jgi:hypothetical protein
LKAENQGCTSLSFKKKDKQQESSLFSIIHLPAAEASSADLRSGLP